MSTRLHIAASCIFKIWSYSFLKSDWEFRVPENVCQGYLVAFRVGALILENKTTIEKYVVINMSSPWAGRHTNNTPGHSKAIHELHKSIIFSPSRSSDDDSQDRCACTFNGGCLILYPLEVVCFPGSTVHAGIS